MTGSESGSSSAAAKDKRPCGLKLLRLIAKACVMVPQPALVAAQLFCQPLGCGIKGWIVIGRVGSAFDHDAAADMHGEIGADQMRLSGEDGVRLDRTPKVFDEKSLEAGFDMAPQRLADTKLLSGDRQLHVRTARSAHRSLLRA